MDNDSPLILNLDRVNDRGWKHNFLFAEKCSLHAGCEDLVVYWSTEGIYLTFVTMFNFVHILFDVMLMS